MKKLDKFSELFEFRFAERHDLKKSWHLSGTTGERVISWEMIKIFFYMKGDDKKINFVIAKSRKTNTLQSIQGFIPYSNNNQNYTFVVFFKTHPRIKSLLGLETMKRMLQLTAPVTYCGIGTNSKTWLPWSKIL